MRLDGRLMKCPAMAEWKMDRVWIMSNPMMQVDAVMPTSQHHHRHHHHRPITNLSCRNEKMRRRESFATNLWSNEKMRSESSDKFCDVLVPLCGNAIQTEIQIQICLRTCSSVRMWHEYWTETSSFLMPDRLQTDYRRQWDIVWRGNDAHFNYLCPCFNFNPTTINICTTDDEHGDHGRVGVVGVTVKRETFAWGFGFARWSVTQAMRYAMGLFRPSNKWSLRWTVTEKIPIAAHDMTWDAGVW
jgi:hypothetical protein